MINCPFCGGAARDLFSLSLHIDDDHDDGRQLVVAIAPDPSPGELRPTYAGVDIDAVHGKTRVERIYIAGAMTGLPERNYPAFHAEAARLRALGKYVVSPAELNDGIEHEGYAVCMRRDVAAMAKCDSISMLPGWKSSHGATLEHRIAQVLEMRIYEREDVAA